MEKLSELAPDHKTLVGNINLRAKLGWDDSRYNRVKSELLESRAIIAGRGQRGSVALSKTRGAKALSVFVSYSHEDEDLKTELLKHLAPLERLGQIDAWHDRKIKAGEEWDKVISKSLEGADIILLLVSIDFINSKYCYDIELEAALERHAKQLARVVPIILRNCLWQHTSFAKLPALPPDAKAVCSWQDRDEALTKVAEGIRQIGDELLESR